MPPLDEVLDGSVSSLGSTENINATRKDDPNDDEGCMNNDQNQADQVSRRQNRKRRRKSVSFAPRVLVQETLHSRDYTRDEYLASWMTKQDSHRVEASMERSLRHLEMGSSETIEAGICYRGIHEISKPAITRYNTTRKQLLQAVFQEQARQKKHKIFEPEVLALICSVETFDSQQHSLQRALQDECDVQAYLSSTRQMVTRH